MFKYDKEKDNMEKYWKSESEMESVSGEILNILIKHKVSLAETRMLFHEILLNIEFDSPIQTYQNHQRKE